MRIDWSQQSNFRDNEQRLTRLMRVAWVYAAALIIGGIAAVGGTTGPFNTDSELASGAPTTSGGFDRNL